MVFFLIAIAATTLAAILATNYKIRQKNGQQPNPVTLWSTSGILVGAAVLPYPVYQAYKPLPDLFGYYTPIAIPLLAILALLSFGYAAWELGNILKAWRKIAQPIQTRSIDPGSVYPSRRGRPPHY